MTRYKSNQNYFDEIDSEEKAYMLGFLFADGYVSEDGFNTTITLSHKDKYILEKFSSLIFENKPVYDRASKQHPGKIYSRLDICGKRINSKLCELGCVPAKSLILKFPESLLCTLHNHFIRGYFDGDGSIIVSKRKYNNYTVTITSTLIMCEKIRDIIYNDTGIYGKIYKHKNIYRYTVRGARQVEKISNFLYKDSTIFLQRKFDKFNLVINNNKITDNLSLNGSSGYKKNDKSLILEEDYIIICNLYSDGLNLKELSKLINSDQRKIRSILKAKSVHIRKCTKKQDPSLFIDNKNYTFLYKKYSQKC